MLLLKDEFQGFCLGFISLSPKKPFTVIPTSFLQNYGDSVTLITVLTTVKCRSLQRLGWQPVASLLPVNLRCLVNYEVLQEM